MKAYEVEITGTSPLLWNRMKRDIQLEMKELKKNELDEWETDAQNWLRKAEIDQAGTYPKGNENVHVPPEWLKAMIVNAFKHSKVVPSFATTKKETFTRYAGSFVIQNGTPICKVNELVGHGAYVSGQGKAGGGKVYRMRPMLETWTHKFVVLDPFGRMEQRELEDALEFGGIIEGIGDGRSMNFGRFSIKSVKEIKEA